MESRHKHNKSVITCITIYNGAYFSVLLNEKRLYVLRKTIIRMSIDFVLDTGRHGIKYVWNIKSYTVFGGVSYWNGVTRNISVSGGVRMC